jgi:hypothetical protein
LYRVETSSLRCCGGLRVVSCAAPEWNDYWLLWRLLSAVPVPVLVLAVSAGLPIATVGAGAIPVALVVAATISAVVVALVAIVTLSLGRAVLLELGVVLPDRIEETKSHLFGLLNHCWVRSTVTRQQSSSYAQ